MGFALLLALTRLIGNKQLGQLNVFTYISGIAIGNMAGEMILHRDVKLLDGISGMVLWGIFTITIELVSLKSAKARNLLDGQPVILIKRGRIMWKELQKERLNVDDLTMLLRSNKVFSILDVEYAILEPNGELSVMKKHEQQGVTRKDMQIPITSVQHIPCEIIVDGKVVEQTMTEFNLDKNWLGDELRKQGLSSPKEVLYAELQQDGQLYLQRKDTK